MNDSNRNTPTNSAEIVTEPSRFERLEHKLLAGIREPLDENAQKKIPLLWQRFIASVDKVPHRVDNIFYGLCIETDKNKQDFYYMAACAVNDFNELPQEFSPIIIPSQYYAVFLHTAHISEIRKTISAAFDWLPKSNWKHAHESTQSVHFFEKYLEDHDPAVQIGGVEIWLPVASLK